MDVSKLTKVYLSTGTNLGDRLENLGRANDFIRERIGPIIKESSIYITAAWGVEDQPSFYNQVLEINTELEPIALLDQCQEIEQELGRKRDGRWGKRTLDIDILYFGSEIIKVDRLQVPHKLLHLRNFVMIPLLEIAPRFIHPQFEQSTEKIFENCTDTLEVVKLRAEDEV